MTTWKGFRFPMGTFFVRSPDSRFRWGKSDPLTKKVIEWYEFEEDTQIPTETVPVYFEIEKSENHTNKQK